MNRILQHIIGIVVCYLLIVPAYAENTIQILNSHAGESAELLGYLSKAFKGEATVIADETLNEKANLLIVLNNDNPGIPAVHPPILYILPQPSARELQKQDSALYWTPSLAAQLALIRAMLPATNRIGMLVSNNNEDMSWLRSFKQYAAEQSIEVRFQTVDKSRIARQVSELAAATDVLLAQPDTDIYNRDTIRFILLAAYRQNKVLIGPSPAFINAGALATLYAPTSVIAEEVVQKVRYFNKNNKLSPASRVKNFSVSLNPQVAKSLGLSVPAMNELERLLRLEELPTWP
jgi:hypothetical protein